MIESSSRSREKLRTAEIEVSEISETNLDILASIRYRPENESEHDTDHYGYVQTKLQPVVRLQNLSEEEIAEVIEFFQDTMAEETIYATRRKSIAEKLQDRASKVIE